MVRFSFFISPYQDVFFIQGFARFMPCLIVLLTILVSYLIRQFILNSSLLNWTLFVLSVTSFLCFVLKFYLYFFFLFECSVILIVFMLFFWGGYRTRYEAGYYFVMYSLLRSVPFIVCCTYLSSMGIFRFSYPLIFWESGRFICFFFLIGFIVKTPVYPFHLWLLKTHLESPVYGSMFLAGILLKVGIYGFRQFFIIHLWYVKDVYLLLGCLGRALISLHCLRCNDMKLLVANSSIVHIILCVACLTQGGSAAIYGCVLIIFSHGLASSGLFFLCNNLYEVVCRRLFSLSKGLLCSAPFLCLFSFLLLFCNMRGPPSINFMSEVYSLFRCIRLSFFIIIFLISACFFCGVYCIYFYYLTISESRSNLSTTKLDKVTNINIYFIHTAPCLIFFLIRGSLDYVV